MNKKGLTLFVVFFDPEGDGEEAGSHITLVEV
jgi:hypothetical protein